MTIQDGPTGVTYSYDNNGNTTVENRGGIVTNYTYNKRNKVRVILTVQGSRDSFVTMTYDGDGLRRTKSTDDGLITYVWDGSDYLQERD